MLVLMDRGFDGGDFLAEVAATRAQFLVRLTATRRPPVLGRLPDGSVLSLIGGVKVRIIEASVTVTCHDGTRYGGSYRLATTLLDHRAYPAQALTCLYHERWEHEITYLALRHTLLPAGYCAPATRPAWNRRCGRCWPCTRRCGSPSPTPSRPCRAPTPTGPATRSPSETAQILVTGARNITGEPPTWPATSAARSWQACTGRAGPASAPAGSNPRSAAGTSTRPANPGPA